MSLFSGGLNGTSAKVRKKSLSSSLSSRSAILYLSNGINRWALLSMSLILDMRSVPEWTADTPISHCRMSSWGKMAACDFTIYCFQYGYGTVVWSVKDETPSGAHWSIEHIRWQGCNRCWKRGGSPFYGECKFDNSILVVWINEYAHMHMTADGHMNKTTPDEWMEISLCPSAIV